MGRFIVPFGTNPDDYELTKGVIIVYDTFDSDEEDLVNNALALAETRKFDKVILYPLHEKTSRRMDITISDGYKNRIKKLEDIILHLDTDVTVELCKLEGKRSKYTPIDTALNFITEYQKGPYFLMISDSIANKFATYSTFDKWIREIRLIIFEKDKLKLHENLINNKKRLEKI